MKIFKTRNVTTLFFLLSILFAFQNIAASEPPDIALVSQWFSTKYSPGKIAIFFYSGAFYDKKEVYFIIQTIEKKEHKIFITQEKLLGYLTEKQKKLAKKNGTIFKTIRLKELEFILDPIRELRENKENKNKEKATLEKLFLFLRKYQLKQRNDMARASIREFYKTLHQTHDRNVEIEFKDNPDNKDETIRNCMITFCAPKN